PEQVPRRLGRCGAREDRRAGADHRRHPEAPARPVRGQGPERGSVIKLFTRTGWSVFLVALVCVCAVAPVANLVVPAGSIFHLSDYAVALVGKIMCYAICALAMDLIWGYTGILSLGHGLFF